MKVFCLHKSRAIYLLFTITFFFLAACHQDKSPLAGPSGNDANSLNTWLPTCTDWFGTWCVYPISELKKAIKSGQNINEIREIELITDWLREPMKIEVSPLLAAA